MSSLKKMKLVPFGNDINPNEKVNTNPQVAVTEEENLINVTNSNLDENLKKNLISDAEEISKNPENIKPKPTITSRKLLTPPTKKKPKSSKVKKDLFERVKWTPY